MRQQAQKRRNINESVEKFRYKCKRQRRAEKTPPGQLAAVSHSVTFFLLFAAGPWTPLSMEVLVVLVNRTLSRLCIEGFMLRLPSVRRGGISQYYAVPAYYWGQGTKSCGTGLRQGAGIVVEVATLSFILPQGV
jgi:hypothetical protein